MLTAAVLALGLLAGSRPPVERIVHQLEPLPVDGCFDGLALDPSHPDVLRDIKVGGTGTLWVGACEDPSAIYQRLPDRRRTTLPLR